MGRGITALLIGHRGGVERGGEAARRGRLRDRPHIGRQPNVMGLERPHRASHGRGWLLAWHCEGGSARDLPGRASCERSGGAVTRPSEKGAPSAPERIWIEVAAHQLYAGREQFWPSNIEYIRADAARPMIAEELEKHAQALRD